MGTASVYWHAWQNLSGHVPVCLWLCFDGFLLLWRKWLSYQEEAEEGVIALLADCYPGSAFFIDYP